MDNEELNKTEEVQVEDAVEVGQTTKASTTENDPKKKDDDDFSWGGCIFVLILLVAGVWALIHFNPSKEQHKETISEVLVESAIDGYYPSPSAANALSKAKYHSIGILSWTSTKYHGKTKIVTIGAVGWVHPFFDIQ